MDEQQSDEVFDSAYELYQEIRDNRGLHLRSGDGRDDVLYRELQDSIGCHDEDIADFLKKENKSADWLLRQFLQLAAPFASMFTEIWDFLSSEKAPRVTEDLRVRFGFDEDDVTEVDIEQFREWAETARKISFGANVAYWSDEAVNELFEFMNRIDVKKQYGSEYRRGEPYELPIIETCHNDDFENYVRRIRNLLQYVINEQAERDEFKNSAFGADTEGRKKPLINLTDLLPGWEPIFRSHDMVSEKNRRRAEKYFREHIKPELEMESIVGSLNHRSPLDILRLPFWEKRWHTYEIWMTVQSIEALDNFEPQVRIDDGRIPIDGRDEAVVADLERTKDCEACVVSELRTPYETDEREAIQPDLSICRTQELDKKSQPISTEQLDKESRVVIIEYKQHKRLSPAHAEERAESYLDGSPEAVRLVMVNYDEPTDVNFPDKAQLIGNVRPGSPKVGEYREVVQEYIKQVEQIEPLQQWAVLVDVSGSMGDVYTQPDVKDALLKLLDMGGLGLEIYKFNSGLTQNPQASKSEIKKGLRTRGGTDVEAAIEELCKKYNKQKNLLVVTDGNYSHLDSLPQEIEDIEECVPRHLSSDLETVREIIGF